MGWESGGECDEEIGVGTIQNFVFDTDHFISLVEHIVARSMSRIRIKNFGPIKEGNVENDGWIDIKKVTVFIGNQGSGKSTVAKLISTFTWLEKALVRGDIGAKYIGLTDAPFTKLMKYHRLENYFHKSPKSQPCSLEYIGDAFHIEYRGGLIIATENENVRNDFSLPQIMYVPAERNLVSFIKAPSQLKLSSEPLNEFISEFNNAKDGLIKPLALPINEVELEFDSNREVLQLKGQDYRIDLFDASSGFQSLVPLFLVSQYLSKKVKTQREYGDSMSTEEIKRFKNQVKEIYGNTNLTGPQQRAAISALASKFNKTSFVNIVEEPEQNLFPTSQRQMLNSLLEFNYKTSANKLIMTTHSPYLINYLSISVQAADLKERIDNKGTMEQLNKIVPINSTVPSDDLIIYELSSDGTLSRLDSYHGIPSDANELNQSLAQGNELFDQLLELEQGL
jgi:predicted ATPase